MNGDEKDDLHTSFNVSFTLFMFCCWCHNWLHKAFGWHHNGGPSTWKLIFSYLDTGFILYDIQGWSCKKFSLLTSHIKHTFIALMQN